MRNTLNTEQQTTKLRNVINGDNPVIYFFFSVCRNDCDIKNTSEVKMEVLGKRQQGLLRAGKC